MPIDSSMYWRLNNAMPRNPLSNALNAGTQAYDASRQRGFQDQQAEQNALAFKMKVAQAQQQQQEQDRAQGIDVAAGNALGNIGRLKSPGMDQRQMFNAEMQGRAPDMTGTEQVGVSGQYKAIFPSKDSIERTSGQKEWSDLVKDLSPEDQLKARRIKLRLDPGAMGSASQTIVNIPGMTDKVATSEATIKEAGKFAEMQGSQRSQVIDKSYDKIVKLDQNIMNLDNAVDAVKAGAGTGAITKRFPSIKQSSVMLDQVQGALALDVIGSVTFGALSEGELNLAKAIAIPTGLEGPELIKWLTDKKMAQQKLLGYYKEQIEFLDQGGSVAGFLRSKSRGSSPKQQAQGQPQGQPQVIRFDAQGNQIQ